MVVPTISQFEAHATEWMAAMTRERGEGGWLWFSECRMGGDEDLGRREEKEKERGAADARAPGVGQPKRAGAKGTGIASYTKRTFVSEEIEGIEGGK